MIDLRGGSSGFSFTGSLTYSYPFTIPGRYRYFGFPHEAAGMIGEAEVEPAETGSP